ncbi:MAG: FKBP-type peptidyl-prolyl cis-trans isomerase [Balneola sp.]|nr:FKBP-type peptidyl-prolyl cis-trans isomerase [Balneola sp.]MBO6650752.1 FKBP-type peptidyl-prolyl cis-trans isomerase [Balneola sp.]MBO6710665.1 FKBP-type peptidyl-prolyl cis-trans isomerase [Balneola sp.]MBO6799351.1 FKBP-type peptidyl-prolyl cis-trans isomerase [Balneola sp.]MBO6869520.1 FKBP-type peptidyl-prolyl cis-trans isomerase [Balneola sp.]
MTFKNSSTLAAFLLLLTGFACDNSNNSSINKEVSLSSAQDSISFALGYQNGDFFAREGATDFSYDAYISGFINGIEQSEALDQATRNSLINDFRIQLTTALKEKNKAEGDAFLAENKTKEGVMETESGLQYKVIEAGTGASPTAESTVEVHYEGTLIDGTKFDSSYDRGETIEFPLNGVIRGWTEGLQLMKEGATYMFYIPSNLAYGENPRPGGPIKPNSTLIFKVELISVK